MRTTSSAPSTPPIGQSTMSSVSDTAQSAPAAVRKQAPGNPLAAGLVAFGAGLVGAALIPASEKEQQAAIAVMDKAQPLQQQVSDVAKDAAALG